MKHLFSTLLFVLMLTATALFFTNCNSTTDNPSIPSPNIIYGQQGQSLPLSAGQFNVMPITVGCQYPNEPCVSVTICTPGSTTNCQTIPNVLLDTGSSGLRLFSQVMIGSTPTNLLSLTVQSYPAGTSDTLAECITHIGTGRSQWGPIANADVWLGNASVVTVGSSASVSGGEVASDVPVQIINSSYPTGASGNCATTNAELDTSPTQAGYNGVLGVGIYPQDCGQTCGSSPWTTGNTNGNYYSCASGTCTAELVASTNMGTNPVSMLTMDNNGIAVQIPSVPEGGSASVTGFMVIGIATESNNIPNGASAFGINIFGDITTQANGISSLYSYIDSSAPANFIYAQTGSFPSCTGTIDGGSFPLYCPTSEASYSAIIAGIPGYATVGLYYDVGDATTLLASSNTAFSDLVGPMPASYPYGSSSFAWGMPFFFGRTVFVQLSTQATVLGSGALWAY